MIFMLLSDTQKHKYIVYGYSLVRKSFVVIMDARAYIIILHILKIMPSNW